MNAILARTFARMHSKKWRTHYGDEFEALLLDSPASLTVVLDIAQSICSSRPREVNATVAAVTVALLASVAAPYRHAPDATPSVQRAIATPVAVRTSSPCRTYSSVARSEFVQQHRCLG